MNVGNTETPQAVLDELLKKYKSNSGVIFTQSNGELYFQHPYNSDNRIHAVVSHRHPDEAEKELPGIKKKLQQAADSQVAFYGNGLSTLPIWYTQFKSLGSKNTPYVVDMLNLDYLHEDTQRLLQILGKSKFMPKVSWKSDLESLLRSRDRGNIRLVQYLFGSKHLPHELKSINLAINCVGPPLSTIDEQISTLALNGELITTNPRVVIRGTNFQVSPLNGGGNIVKRIK